MASGTSHIRIGVVGARRGMTFARGAAGAEMELVAVCDTWKERLDEAGASLGVATYSDYDEFLEHEMDGVVLANFFHDHAPFAIKALGKGLHVMSECAACFTVGEGVELIRAVEASGKTYMLAENYPYMVHNQEMKRLYSEGVVGKFVYGEGEYVHPDSARTRLARSCGWDHWRNFIPSTYYCTHSIAPVMYITDTRPVAVSGFVVPHDFDDPTLTMTARKTDTAAVIICKMDNGAIMKSLHGGLRGHQNYTRIHGNRGLMENARFGSTSMVRLRREPFEKEHGEPADRLYQPDFPVHHDEATRAGHGGGDFFTNYHFAEAIRSGTPPYLDVYRAVDMSIAGILAYRSALNGSGLVELPDLRDESVRRACEDDHWRPDPVLRDADHPPLSVLGEIEPTDEAKRFAETVWIEEGWDRSET